VLIKSLGLLLVILGISINKWTLKPFAEDGDVDAIVGVLFFFAFQWPAIFIGTALAMQRSLFKYRRTFNVLMATTSLLIGAALLEGAIRYVRFFDGFVPWPRTYVGEFENRESPNFISDTHTGWRMRPKHEFDWTISGERDRYRSNAQGFRSEWNFDLPTSRKKIALLGDSFTWGTGVEYEETYGQLLAAALGDDFAAYNLAMPGFGLDQMWMSLRHQALPLIRPSLVIVAFIDDDLDRCFYAYRKVEGFNKPTFELEHGKLRPQTSSDGPNALIRFLDKYSGIWAGMRRNASREVGFNYSLGDWWAVNQAIFEAIIADAKQAGTPLLFVRLPLRQPKRFPSLHRLAESEGVALLDLGSPDDSRPHSIHFVDDAHINEAGHAYVAEQLSAWIRENQLVTK
jgi:hypothetical protein